MSIEFYEDLLRDYRIDLSQTKKSLEYFKSLNKDSRWYKRDDRGKVLSDIISDLGKIIHLLNDNIIATEEVLGELRGKDGDKKSTGSVCWFKGKPVKKEG